MQKLIDEFVSLGYPSKKTYTNILPVFQRLSFQRPELLLAPGQVLTRLYLVRKGYVRVYRKRKNGKAMRQIVREGNWISLPASFDLQMKAEEYVEVCKDSEVYCIERDDYNRLFREDGDFAKASQRILIKLLEAAQGREDILRLGPPVSLRLDKVFADAPDVLEYVSQKDVADFAAVSPSSVSRYRARLKKGK